MTEHIQFDRDHFTLLLLDQRKLPTKTETYVCQNVDDIVYALVTMVVRGAPAIGVTAAYGCAIAARQAMLESKGKAEFLPKLDRLLETIANARPTAVNLAWAVTQMRCLLETLGENPEPQAVVDAFLAKATEMHAEDIEINRIMGAHGGELIPDGATVMTHCNAGALATAGYGTALGVIRGALDQGKKIKVIANETRPFLQGARLTAYELARDKIPVTVACDNACALLMQKGMVDAVVVGADRVAANGDAANKIGTFGVALIAKHFGVPFYVAAPLSTLDENTPTGAEIPIEERTPTEVTHVGVQPVTPEGVPVFNYAFDVTPAEFIAGIVTEAGVLRPPYGPAIAAAKAQAAKDN